MAMVGLCNGERAVVLLVIIRICFSISIPLLWQGIALFLLACIGLFVEISVDNSSGLTCFKSRPGASSGILLGTVSLPTVMLSRLIQLSRAVSDHEVEPEELGYVNLHYWAASASSLGVLIFLSVVMSSLGNNRSSYRLGCGQAFYLFFFGVLSYLSLAAKSFGGSYVVAKLVWTFCHGLASVRLILHILRAFPSCASIGEALLVTGGLVLFFGEMLARTLTKVNVHSLSKKLISVQYGARRSEISILIQGLLLGLLLLPMFYKFVLRTWVYFTRLINSEAHTIEGRASGEIKKSVIFFGSLGVILTVAFPAWVQLVQDFELHPLLWILMYVFMEPFKRILLCMYWLGVICSSVLCFYKISKNNKTERILLRKYYHILAVVMFIPAFIFQPDFLDLAFGAALAVFLALEMIRVWRIWPLGHIVHHFMNAFTDHRDSDILIVSHFSLLLGCAIPKWMSSGFNDRPLTPFAGLLSLGIGDTMASMVGHKYGVLRWSKSGKKTIEGTAAGITSVLAACSVLLWLLASTGYIFSQHWLSLLLAVTLSGLLEAYTAQLDNAFIPLVFYSLLCL